MFVCNKITILGSTYVLIVCKATAWVVEKHFFLD